MKRTPLLRKTPMKRSTKPMRKASKKVPGKVSVKELDTIFSLVIRTRDGKCLKCGKETSLQCSHVITRSSRGFRWDETNAITLCVGCHIYWWHKEPLEAEEWLRTSLPLFYEHWQLNRQRVVKISVADRTDLYEQLKKRLEELETN